MADVATRPLSRTDHTWFAGQVETLLPALYGTAVRLCRDRTDGEDLVAETIAKAWEAFPALRNRDTFRGWMFRILTNTFLSQYRADRARGEVESFDASDDGFSLFERVHQPILLWWGNPEQDFLNGLLRDDLIRAIDELPDRLRTVVVLVDVQALSYREVSTALKIPVGTVRSRLARGRGLLQKALWENARDAGLRAGPQRSGGEDQPDDQR
ncbi:RNA polymerase sigma factor [Phytoactinopolyspora mesophila]|uniref:Sigma-70 family RNA polymerase sigma factor n=1 Tax=Phytoactinopolyspora mesophila TaxID=2650750 RepID=A0A7K3MCL7_9ACTN|nr:sigma-70 family RNA polymerase sigma factor [Phytoactinopolyspora mesophila]NDL60930.1 sigma-70 family RNA polymerase sigma factor [Phytoactinopolyspora mesophila]